MRIFLRTGWFGENIATGTDCLFKGSFLKRKQSECLKGFCVARQSKSLELNWYWNVGVGPGEPDVRDEFL